ncbi:MAG: hypothetical protein OSB00_17380 [Sphingomonas bacterium]|nr:hypothetical protein [Sphingomonas bacterium]
MHTVIQTLIRPITTMNRRVSIGGTGLSLLIAGEIAMTLFRPLA